LGGEAGPSQLTRIRPRQGRATKQGEVSICVFSGIAPVSNGKKDAAPEDVSVQGPDAPLAHRRPGYSSSGCTPAEPDSASPGNGILSWRRTRHNERAIVVRLRDPVIQGVSRQDRERDSGCIPGSDMAHCDAAGVNGSNRIFFMALRYRG